MEYSKIVQVAEQLAVFNGIESNLVLSIIKAESNFDPYAIRFEPHWKLFVSPEGHANKCRISVETEKILQGSSLGLMQVMGAVARELGHKDNLLHLTRPETAIKYGCLKIKDIMRKFTYLDDVIAAYNAGTPRRNEDGTYKNQAYVTKVKTIYLARMGVKVD